MPSRYCDEYQHITVLQAAISRMKENLIFTIPIQFFNTCVSSTLVKEKMEKSINDSSREVGYVYAVFSFRIKKWCGHLCNWTRISSIFRMIISELLNYSHITQDALEYFPQFDQSEATMNSTACVFCS